MWVPMDAWNEGPPARALARSGCPGDLTVAHLSLGAFCLLAILCVIVWAHPPPEIPQTQAGLNEMALQRRNIEVYFRAVAVAKTLVPGGARLKWAHFVIDLGTRSDALRNGLWSCQGLVDVPAQGGEAEPTRWDLVFDPQSGRTIYFRMGDTVVGDAEAAQQARSEP